MKFKAALVVTSLLLTASATWAQTTTTTTTSRTSTWDWNERFSYDSEGERFRANEFTLDVFGSYQRDSDNWDDFFDEPEHGRWGGGLGVNYFFTRNFGLGVDAFAHDNRGAFVDHVNTSAIIRFPIDAISLAPYIFGGGGYMFDPDDNWSVHAGAGLEFRINPNTGIFIDGRYAWGENSTDYSLIRSGFRFAF